MGLFYALFLCGLGFTSVFVCLCIFSSATVSWLLGKLLVFIIKVLFKNADVRKIGLWKLEKISFSFPLDAYTPRIEIDTFGYSPASWMGWVTLGGTQPLLTLSIEGVSGVLPAAVLKGFEPPSRPPVVLARPAASSSSKPIFSSTVQKILLSRTVHSLLCFALRALRFSLVDVRLGLATELSCLALNVGSVQFLTARREPESQENFSVASHLRIAQVGLYFLPVYTYVAPPPPSAAELVTAAVDPLPNLEQQGVPLFRAAGADLSFAYEPPYRRNPMVVNALQLAVSPVLLQANLEHSVPFVDYVNTLIAAIRASSASEVPLLLDPPSSSKLGRHSSASATGSSFNLIPLFALIPTQGVSATLDSLVVEVLDRDRFMRFQLNAEAQVVFASFADELSASIEASVRNIGLISSTAPGPYLSLEAVALRSQLVLQQPSSLAQPLLTVRSFNLSLLGPRVNIPPTDIFVWVRTCVRTVVMSFTRPRRRQATLPPTLQTVERVSSSPSGFRASRHTSSLFRLAVESADFLLQSSSVMLYDTENKPLVQFTFGDITGKLLRDDSNPTDAYNAVSIRVDGVRGDLEPHRPVKPVPDVNNRIAGNFFSLLTVALEAEIDTVTFACRRVSIDVDSLFFEINYQLLDTVFLLVSDLRTRALELMGEVRRMRMMLPDASTSSSLKIRRPLPRLQRPQSTSSSPIRIPFPVNVLLHDLRLVVATDLNDTAPETPILFLDVGVIALQALMEQKVSVQVRVIDLLHLGEVERVIYKHQSTVDCVPFVQIKEVIVDIELAQLSQQILPTLVTANAPLLSWQLGLHISLVQLALGFVERIVPFVQSQFPSTAPKVTSEEAGVVKPPGVLLAVEVTLNDLNFEAIFAQIGVIQLAVNKGRILSLRLAELSNAAVYLGNQRARLLTVPTITVLLKDTDELPPINLVVDAADPIFQIAHELDFGEILAEMILLGKAVGSDTASRVRQTLAKISPPSAASGAKGSAKPPLCRVLNVEARVVRPRFEVADDPLQVSISNFYKVQLDEVAERLLRAELIEQKMNFLKLKAGQALTSDENKMKALRAKAAARMQEMDAQIYCQRAKYAAKHSPGTLLTATSPLIKLTLGLDIADSVLTERLLALHKRTVCFPSEKLPPFDTMVGLVFSIQGNVQMHLRDYPLPFVSVTQANISGAATFAEEIPQEQSLLRFRIRVTPTKFIYSTKTLTSVKLYYELDGTADHVGVTIGTGYQAGLKEMGSVLALFGPENLDWCPPMAWWDKMRQVLHGIIHAKVKHFQLTYTGTRNPYNKMDNLVVDGTDVEGGYMTGQINVMADRLRVKISSRDSHILDAGQAKIDVRMTFRCPNGADPHNHWVVPNNQNCADTDPVEMDVAYRGSSFPWAKFVPGWQEPPPAHWPIIDTNANYRAVGLQWDIDVSLSPGDGSQPVIILDPSAMRWFLRFGQSSAFPEVWLQETISRRTPYKGTLSSVIEGLNLHLKLPERTALRFWEARDKKSPLGFEVRVDEVDWTLCLVKVTPEPHNAGPVVVVSDGPSPDPAHSAGPIRKWTWKPKPFTLRNLHAIVFTPQGAARFYDALTDASAKAPTAPSNAEYSGDFLCAAAQATLRQEATDMYTIEKIRILWTRQAREAVYNWLDRFHQWRITFSYSANTAEKESKEREARARASNAAQRQPQLLQPTQQTKPPLTPRGVLAHVPVPPPTGPPPVLERATTSAEILKVFENDSPHSTPSPLTIRKVSDQPAPLSVLSTSGEASGNSISSASKPPSYSVFVLEPQITLQAEEAKGAILITGKDINIQGHASFVLQNGVTRERNSVEMRWQGFSTNILDEQASQQLRVTPMLAADIQKRVLRETLLRLDMTYSLSDADDELNENQDPTIVKIRAENLDFTLQSQQFQVLVAIINYLLLEPNANTVSQDEQLEAMMFKTQLSGEVVGDIPKVRNRVRRLRVEVKDLESQLSDLRVKPGDTGEVAATLEEELKRKKKAYNDAFLQFQLLVLSERKRRDAEREALQRGSKMKAPLFRVEVDVGKASWQLLTNPKPLPTQIADAQLTGFNTSITFYEDSSANYFIQINNLNIKNQISSSDKREMFSLLKPERWRSSDVILRIVAEHRAPVGGIFVYDHWEVNLAPIFINLSDNIHTHLFEYFFPAEETKEAEKSADQKSDAKNNTESQSASELKRRKKGATDVEQMRVRARWFRSFVYIKITETEVGVTFKLFDNLRLKLHPLAYHGNTWTFKELMQNLKRDIILDLLTQGTSFIKALTRKKDKDPPMPLPALPEIDELKELEKTQNKKNKKSATDAFSPEALKTRLLFGSFLFDKDKEKKEKEDKKDKAEKTDKAPDDNSVPLTEKERKAKQKQDEKEAKEQEKREKKEREKEAKETKEREKKEKKEREKRGHQRTASDPAPLSAQLSSGSLSLRPSPLAIVHQSASDPNESKRLSLSTATPPRLASGRPASMQVTSTSSGGSGGGGSVITRIDKKILERRSTAIESSPLSRTPDPSPSLPEADRTSSAPLGRSEEEELAWKLEIERLINGDPAN